MKKIATLVLVTIVSLAMGIGIGAAVFWWNHHNVEESFVPYNPSADPNEFRPSQ